MNWLNFLHFYQPANQQKDILKAVIDQSYVPIFNKIANIDNISLTINITGSLLDLFKKYGYDDLLLKIKESVNNGKIELTGSCKYHAFLPLIPENEIKRQIQQNNETLRSYFGDDLRIKGFFPPEMGYDPKINKILEEFGFKYVIIDEIAYKSGKQKPRSSKLYKIKDTNLNVFFRDRRVSNLVMSAVARDIETLDLALQEEFSNPYLVTGMDGETFGHHRIGFEQFLFKLLENKKYNIISFSKFLSSSHLEVEQVEPQPSTWASSMHDIENNIQFLSWLDKNNEIHKYQWNFYTFALGLVNSMSKDKSQYEAIRKKMDIAAASDHFWWASAKPWWSLEMIEDGAFRLLDVVKSIPDISEEDLYKASDFYEKIVSTASSWQRQGVVREMAMQQNEALRIPFKERTLNKGGDEEGVYWAFIDLMKEQEKLAAEKGDYEKATLWRDAVYKLDKKQDIYDTISAIDLLRIDVGNGEVEKVISEYKEKFHKLRGGQPEQRGS